MLSFWFPITSSVKWETYTFIDVTKIEYEGKISVSSTVPNASHLTTKSCNVSSSFPSPFQNSARNYVKLNNIQNQI